MQLPIPCAISTHPIAVAGNLLTIGAMIDKPPPMSREA